MPAKTGKQRAFMGAELGRKRRGEATETGMSESQLSDFAKKPKGRRARGNPMRYVGSLCLQAHHE